MDARTLLSIWPEAANVVTAEVFREMTIYVRRLINHRADIEATTIVMQVSDLGLFSDEPFFGLQCASNERGFQIALGVRHYIEASFWHAKALNSKGHPPPLR
jgi:hypothetical protein